MTIRWHGVQAGWFSALVVLVVSGTSALAGPFASGATYVCQAKNATGSKTWPCTLKVTAVDASSGALSGELSGELTWSSLNSVHRIHGTLSGDRLTFTEVEAIHPGGAHLRVAYTMTVSERAASGGWVDPADQSRGTMSIELGPTAAPVPKSPPVSALTNGSTFSCVAKDSGGAKSWPCTFRVTTHDASTGALVGEVAWTSLGSVHRVRGTLSGDRLTFTEAEAIRTGAAHLRVAYDMTVSERAASGTWTDPADQSRGTMSIDLGAR